MRVGKCSNWYVFYELKTHTWSVDPNHNQLLWQRRFCFSNITRSGPGKSPRGKGEHIGNIRGPLPSLQVQLIGVVLLHFGANVVHFLMGYNKTVSRTGQIPWMCWVPKDILSNPCKDTQGVLMNIQSPYVGGEFQSEMWKWKYFIFVSSFTIKKRGLKIVPTVPFCSVFSKGLY